MSEDNSDNVTFQLTVVQLTLSPQISKKDVRVTVTVGDVSKITCSGKSSLYPPRVTWKHPFLFTASTSTTVRISVCALPEKLTPEWNKQPLGNQISTSVASLLKSGNGWKSNVTGLSGGGATLSMTCKVADKLIAPSGHDCITALSEYDMKLFRYGQQLKNLSFVSTQIELGLARLDLCPKGHPDYTVILNDLSYAFDFRYHQEGNTSDINKALEISQTRLDLCPLGHTEHALALGRLAVTLWKYYCIQRNAADLNRLVELQQKWLDLCPSGHQYHVTALGELAISLLERYYKKGDIIDLDRSISMRQEVLDLRLEGDHYYGMALGNLATSLSARYQKQGDLADLDRVIRLEERRLEISPQGHQSHGVALRNLGFSLQNRYKKLKGPYDLLKALDLFKKALKIYQVQHHAYAMIVGHLASTTLLQSSLPDQPKTLLDEAFDTYELLKKCGPAASLDLWQATQAWAQDAETHDHSTVLEAYQTSLSALDHFTSLTSSLDSRHETMQARVGDLANNAFSCAIRHGKMELAVELLEQGRGILWSQLARFDISLATLEGGDDRARDLATKFKRLSGDLRKHAQGIGGKDVSPYWKVQEEWQSVVDEIRSLDGFSRFLLPPRFGDLREAAELGPVIIVNASKYGCDALIIRHTLPPIHVPLKDCELDDVIDLCQQLSVLTQDPHAYGDNRESWVKKNLRELWSSVVKPIVKTLQGDDIKLPPGSRIWWCPTSKLTVLPLHAAGPHQGTAKNLLDIYVSSYAPSLSALVRTRDRIRAQRRARSRASKTSNAISFAAVGQRKPSADTGLCELPEVELEIDKIRSKTGMPGPERVKFEAFTADAATIEGAVQAFRGHRWIHIACHGAQHAEKPFESWFAMGDGKLTLMRIIRERYTDSEFAFLSACHTAVGDASTPDEVLHLAAGMQFAGFDGVIGTLWKVDDSVAHQVVTQFYKGMFKRPEIDFEHAAVALNTAVVETINDVSLEKRIVFVHIGV